MQITLEDLDPYGQGTKDEATGLYESYALPDSHPFNTEPQWRIHRATTDKLPGVLNEESENGRTVHSVHFTGGRDWIVITCRTIAPVLTLNAHDVNLDEAMQAISTRASVRIR